MRPPTPSIPLISRALTHSPVYDSSSHLESYSGRNKGKEKSTDQDDSDGLYYRTFSNEEEDLENLMRLVEGELSEPYVLPPTRPTLLNPAQPNYTDRLIRYTSKLRYITLYKTNSELQYTPTDTL
jgi:hypothetical protein